MSEYTAWYGAVNDPAHDNLEDDAEVMDENGIDYEIVDATEEVAGHDVSHPIGPGRLLVFPDEENALAASEFVIVTDPSGERMEGRATLRF